MESTDQDKMQMALESQTKMLYLIIPQIDTFIKASIAEGFVRTEDSASMVMNLITNLFNLLITNSWNNGARKPELAAFMKEGLAALAQHTLNKLSELPNDAEAKEETETTH